LIWPFEGVDPKNTNIDVWVLDRSRAFPSDLAKSCTREIETLKPDRRIPDPRAGSEGVSGERRNL